ncbi:2TM domain-containing protein [Subsaxibacter sp. CAU 1640]|uniref:2TM domain-containing protein n=1 Tax=Subsaxibacter sp. CAU 1640 TaxID=2933271 RepID=UPI002002D1B7|nr:2TM domain-containing protein [Subsaxibacter sp. CAU 1640]MCK7589865.1 2TM domain-containing protein [Subsaxibacter sp. CAU 1640]
MIKSFKNIYLTFFIGCAVFVVGNLLFEGFDFENFNDFLVSFSFYQMYSFLLGYSNYYYFAYLEKLNWTKEERFKRIIIGIVGSVIVTMIGLFIMNAFQYIAYRGISWTDFIEGQRWSQYRFGLWITLTIVIIFHIVYFYNRYQQTKVKEQKVIAGSANARFDALKNQLDPHFLFNSLNVLTSLIDENPENAQKFTTSLSKVYRYVLEQKNKDLVSVDEELDFARTYMLLLKMRFEDSIIFEIPEKANNPESKVVPLSLQLLLENAVKHNMVTTSKPLHVKIYESNGMLVVENNLQPKQIVKKSSGVGLANIQQRYELLTNKKVNINQQANSFAVAIPMLTKQISIMEIQKYNNQEDAYHKAKKRVEEIKGFYGNLLSYCVVIPFLIFINYWSYWGFQWFWFPMLGWGMGIIFHAFGVFGYGKSWEERKIREIMERDEQRNNTWN